MSWFSNRVSPTTAGVAVAFFFVILLIIVWTSMSAPNVVRNSEDYQTPNNTIRSVPYQFVKGQTQRIDDGAALQYRPSMKPVTENFHVSAFPDDATVKEINDRNDSIKTNNILPSNQDNIIEYVMPLKISENQYEDPPDASSVGKRHHSGNFRLPTSEVWDSHPMYEFVAFGRKFRFLLNDDSKFISPDVKVTHVRKNETIREHPDHQLKCYYSGFVEGDSESDVSVSLCNGMTGHIKTADGNYIIKPVEKLRDDNERILKHAFYREVKNRSNISSAGESDVGRGSYDCGVVDYDTADESAAPPILDSSAGEIHAGERHRERRSSTAKIFWDHSKENRVDKNGLVQFVLPTERWLYPVHGKGNRYNQWEDYRQHKLSATVGPMSPWRHRRTLSREYFIELMIVADQKMVEYHGDGLLSYILVLMSTVSRIYKYPSIGNPISIAVIKIMEVDYYFGIRDNKTKGINATQMLMRFCEWQRSHNPSEPSPEHHDVALLLTREKLCHDPAADHCETLGLAQLGQMCSPNSSCAIVHDYGLATSFTIAHEIGHVLSMPHDDDAKCTKFRISNDVLNLMAKRMDKNEFRWEWSKCSRHYLTEFLETANCLLDEPYNMVATDAIRLPGEDYSGNKQCELVVGPGSKVCSRKRAADVCKRLWCTSVIPGDPQCSTRNVPWADGTPCGDNQSEIKWCRHGECVSVKNLELVNGQWGEWGPYGACSRTCGGGIQKKYRECNRPPPQNGGNYCIGEQIKYRSCGTEECPPDTPDFRQEQCSKFDHDNLNIRGLTDLSNIIWHAKYIELIPENRCKLFCQLDSKQYYKVRNRVIDGTPCGPDSFDICVHGQCKPAGCDHILNSTAKLDICGVCRGNNSTCQRITGSHNSSAYGYTRVVKIPAGSSNIDIRQYGWKGCPNDSNYLGFSVTCGMVKAGFQKCKRDEFGLKLCTNQPEMNSHRQWAEFLDNTFGVALRLGEGGEYILNGKSVMNPKVIILPGITIEYSGPETIVERLNSSRSINVDLVVEVLSVGVVHPAQISYEYIVPKYILKSYEWILKDWSSCNYACQGTSYRKAYCRDAESKQEVPDEYCRAKDKPKEESRVCNSYCTLDWQVTAISECSSHCGSGNRTITSQCIKILKNLEPEPLQTHACAHIERPPSHEACAGPCDAVHWSYDEWQPCSVSCGVGAQIRTATCVNTLEEIVSEEKCDARERTDARACTKEACPKWRIGEWSSCSVTCGTGERRRTNYCVIGKRPVHANHCSGPRPDVSEICDAGVCHHWDISDWSACDTKCGEGRRYRQVVCKSSRGMIVSDTKCYPTKKPRHAKRCHRSICPIATYSETNSSREKSKCRWRVSNWTPCSTDCGEGVQHRSVICHLVNRFGWVDPKRTNCCLPDKRPSESRVCKLRECDDRYFWSPGNWRKCSHPCGRKGKQTRRIFCHDLNGKKTARDKCPIKFKPRRERKCNQRRCGPRTCAEAQKRFKPMNDGEFTLLIGGRSMKIYCHNTATDEPREYLTLPAGDRRNYAEIYDKRLLNPYQCPYNGRKNSSCECVSDAQGNSGFTNFKRVRIDPAKLIIIADDFTFSRTTGAKQQYGQAGDCYSQENCPQGQFSIDLTGTPLKLSPDVTWGPKRSRAFMYVNKVNDQRVIGRCGGYCGYCWPITGLKLDVLPP